MVRIHSGLPLFSGSSEGAVSRSFRFVSYPLFTQRILGCNRVEVRSVPKQHSASNALRLASSRFARYFSRLSALGIGRSSNIELPAASGSLAARYAGNRPNPLCGNAPFPLQQGIEAIGCEVLERLNLPGRPADLQRLNLLRRP